MGDDGLQPSIDAHVLCHDRVFDLHWCRSMGFEPSDRMGLGYCEFCVLDWYWSCWNFDFSGAVPIEAEMEDIDQQGSRGDDNFCSDVCGDFPWHPRGTYLVCMVVVSFAKR